MIWSIATPISCFYTKMQTSAENSVSTSLLYSSLLATLSLSSIRQTKLLLASLADMVTRSNRRRFRLKRRWSGWLYMYFPGILYISSYLLISFILKRVFYSHPFTNCPACALDQTVWLSKRGFLDYLDSCHGLNGHFCGLNVFPRNPFLRNKCLALVTSDRVATFLEMWHCLGQSVKGNYFDLDLFFILMNNIWIFVICPSLRPF